jgi:hypothetical protein
MDLAVVGRIALMLAVATSLPACLITRTDEVRVPTPLTRPRIQDVQGLTTPRLGALLLVDGTDGNAVEFRVPVDDDGVNDPLQFQFFVNDDRDCVPQDGGPSCEPTSRLGAVPSNGTTRRIINKSFLVSDLDVGCNRIELYVSSAFRIEGNFRTPVRDGDVDFRTWWVFVRSPNGTLPPTSIEACRQLVQP